MRLGERFIPAAPDRSVNNGTALGGLAYALQSGLHGYARGKDDRQKKEADAALARALSGGEDGTYAISELEALENNPYASGHLTKILTNQAAQRDARARDEALWKREDERDASRREWDRERDDRQMAFEREMAGIKHANAMALAERKGMGAGPVLTPGQETVDKEFAKEVVVPAFAGGGMADTQKNISQLRSVRGDLAQYVPTVDAQGKEVPAAKSNNMFSPTGAGANWVPDVVKNWINPEAVNTREKVEEVVQRNLRAVLGAQFTEKEGERLIKRAFNPNLDEAINLQRVDALLTATQAASDAKQMAYDYFNQYGTLKGYNGPDWTVTSADLDAAMDAVVPGNTPPSIPPGTVEEGYAFQGGDPADPNSWVPVNGVASR